MLRCRPLQDLYKPEAPRLRRNLSAVINFAKYREEKLLAYTELQEHLEGLLQDKEGLAEENAALQEELRRLQEDRAAEMPVRDSGPRQGAAGL
jgi:kinetochore protein Nuf2